MTPSASLNAARRSAELDWLGNGAEIDLLVVGGGVVGCGVALDAASRGLRVALVERRDLANGTSRWSSKLIHGGLRYLRQAEVGLAWESALERHVMMRWTAPHLVHALPFLVPLGPAVSPGLGMLTGAGLHAGDVLRRLSGSSRLELPPPRRISPEEAIRLAPGLRRTGLRGALLNWDGQAVDDVRIVIALARTAAARGAMVLPYVAAERLEAGRAVLRDELTGRQLEIRVPRAINATGVWAARFDPGLDLRPSRGTHLLVRAAALGDPRAAAIIPVPHASARWVGATPVGEGRVIIGVTDDAHDGPIDDDPQPTDSDRDFLLAVVNLALARPLQAGDVIGSFAGLRPLIGGGGSESTADLSRRHLIRENPDTGVLSVVGGKFTTYRRMAEDVVDRLTNQPSMTRRLPLIGAANRATLEALRLRQTPRLVDRYGLEAPVLTRLAQADPELLEPIAPGLEALGVELVFGMRHEGAMSVDDVLDRRLRLGLVPAERRLAEPEARRLLAGEAA